MIVGSRRVIDFHAEQVFDRRSAVKLYRTSAVEYGFIKVNVTYYETS
jgi:hypothetical protein